jgi:uncharacterized protein (DUF983 family)
VDDQASPKAVNFKAAALGRCPVCQKGKLFCGFLKVCESCSHCGTSFTKAGTGDGPVVFVILIAGFAACFGMMYMELTYSPPLWLQLAVWIPVAGLLSLLLMRPLKGLMLAAQLRHHIRDAS